MTNNVLDECLNNYVKNNYKKEDYIALLNALNNNKFYILEYVDNPKIHRVYKSFKNYKKKNLKYKKDISVYINHGSWYIFIFTNKNEITNINKNIYNNIRKVSLNEFLNIINYDLGAYDNLLLNPNNQNAIIDIGDLYTLNAGGQIV